MTKYTVLWKTSARNELAEIWMNAADRTAITAATHSLDVELANDPERKGMEIREGLRGIDKPPLRALFTVDELDRMVYVDKVRLARPLN